MSNDLQTDINKLRICNCYESNKVGRVSQSCVLYYVTIIPLRDRKFVAPSVSCTAAFPPHPIHPLHFIRPYKHDAGRQKEIGGAWHGGTRFMALLLI